MKSFSETLWCWVVALLVFWGVLLLVNFSLNLVVKNAPETIEVDGFVYERQTEPEQTIEKYCCTYVLKETDE